MNDKEKAACLMKFITTIESACTILDYEFLYTASKLFDDDTMKKLNDARNVFVDIVDEHRKILDDILEVKTEITCHGYDES